MKSQILSRFHEIEAEGNVRIVYACESGSRAWGFPSADSDVMSDLRILHDQRIVVALNETIRLMTEIDDVI